MDAPWALLLGSLFVVSCVCALMCTSTKIYGKVPLPLVPPQICPTPHALLCRGAPASAFERAPAGGVSYPMAWDLVNDDVATVEAGAHRAQRDDV